MNKNFIFAVATLVGGIVGLGMFGIPYAASKAGFFVGVAYLIVLGGVMMLLHLSIGEIAERTKAKHRLTGYIEKYLGMRAKKVVGTVIIFSVYAALLAYIIVAGKFLELIFSDIASAFILGLVFWAVVSTVVLLGIRTIGAVELVMTGFLLLFVGIMFLSGAREVNPSNFSGMNFAEFFLPYGVILFALDGGFAIPEIRELLRLDARMYKRAIILGSFIPVVIYIMFMTMVTGVSGENTSEEALHGLVGYLGPGVISFGVVFGILGIITSYLALGINLKNTFEYDWKLSKNLSGFLVVSVPALMFILGVQEFTEVISFSGAVLGAIIFIFTLLVYQKAQKFGDRKPGYALHLPKGVVWALITMFVLGGVYEIVYLLK